MQNFDAIVVGLGGVGSAATYHLARSGARVLGLERFSPAHDQGSSHGESRIIREAYFEGTFYVPLVRHAYELWAELEQLSHSKLLTITGGLMIGPRGAKVIEGSILSAKKFDIPHEILSASETNIRFPAFRLPDNFYALYEHRAGTLDPEACVRSHLKLAEQHGAKLYFEQPIQSWSYHKDRIEVQTPTATFRADKLLLCSGAWLPQMLPELRSLLSVERQVMHWFRPSKDPENFGREKLPIYIIQDDKNINFYGFPLSENPASGAKTALHARGRLCTPEGIDRRVSSDEIAAMKKLSGSYLPTLPGTHVKSLTCMYTVTLDRDFIIDFHPRSDRVVIASTCSGHGFKFSSAVGKVLADLATTATTHHDISRFALARFQEH